jgi:hypothetical protein
MIDLARVVPPLSLSAYARLQYFETMAHDVSRYYHGHPVYLVGGALRDLEVEPRDVDLVCVLPDATFRWMFGGGYADWLVGRAWPDRGEGTWLRWARDTAKRSESLSEEARRLVDFRTMHEEQAKRYADEPRLRLSVEIIPGR